MKIYEIKDELEKVAKIIPELRQQLVEAYKSDEGKKSKIKLLWKQYENKHRELRESRDYKHLNLQ